LSVPPPDVISCSISCLPVELLSLIFNFLDVGDVSILPRVCELWKVVAVPYLEEPRSVAERYEQLKHYPDAGRFWRDLKFGEGMDVGVSKELIVGSPNATYVCMEAFWNGEEARIVLNAIEGLNRVYDVRFGSGSRKWRKEEIENFVRRMGGRIRRLTVSEVDDSPASASAGLHLSSRLEYLWLHKYPPLPSLSLPQSLYYLYLSHVCPLPSSISDYPLPPLLEYLRIELVPFSADGKTSILPNPFYFAHLTHLTQLILDGGEESSNLVSPELFSTLTNATAIREITHRYCVVDSSDFPDFIRWFFGNWQMRRGEKRDPVGGEEIGWHLEVCLFFGEWMEEEIVIARSTMEAYKTSKESGVWEAEEGVEWWP
ncbi:hypothetical protein BT69DRAFT_247666, partial [Atractiella rhizophila]